jgi:glycosyltransferase involved in cell wall biosynthesis
VRIALFSTSWFDFYVLELAKALAGRHDILIFVDQHDTLMEELDDPRITVERIPWHATRRQPLRNVASIRRILSRLADFRADVVHFQEHDPRMPLLMMFMKSRGVVLDLHNVIPLSGMEHPLRDWLRDRTARRIGSFIVHGAAMTRAVNERYGAGVVPTFEIPLGRFTAFGGDDTEKSESEMPVALFFGRIESYKGIETLVEAAPIVEAALGPRFTIHIVGAGDMSQWSSRIHDRSRFDIVNKRVRDPSTYFREADIVVMPYNEASTSGVTPVAYAYGKPVIVTRVGSLPESVIDGETGLVIPPRDPSALAAAMIKLLTDRQLRQRMGAAGRALLDGPLSWSRNIGNVERAYESAARA